MEIVISNLIGIIALLFWIYSIQQNNKKQILKFQLLANVFYAIQYIIINAITAGMMNIISVIRYGVFYKLEEQSKEKRLPMWVMLVFVCCILFIGICTYKMPIDFIPIGISIWYAYITWQNNTKLIRYGIVIAAIIWIYYNFSVQAYASVLGNLFEIISGLIAIYRFDFKRKRELL